MSQLDLLPRGGQTGPIGRLRNQLQRLFGATIAFTWDRRTAGEWHDSGFRVSNETHLWRNPVRFAPEKWVKIRARAEVHLPPTTYVRQTALGYRLLGRISSRTVAELGRIGTNLNQLTRVANTTGRLDQSARLEAVLNELLDAMRRLA